MAKMATSSVLLALVLCMGLPELTDANNFLRPVQSANTMVMTDGERVSSESVRTSLLEEIEESLSSGSTARRVSRLEAALSPVYAALPKNEYGNLGHGTVRYALHRLFVQRHAWHVEGLGPDGNALNASTAADILKATVPSYLQHLFERRLGGHGFSMHETAVFAATVEHFIHNETLKRLENAYEMKNISQSDDLTEAQVDTIVDQYMKVYILGDKASLVRDHQIQLVYPGWNDTQTFVREMRRNVQYADRDPTKPINNQTHDFNVVTRVVEEIGEHYGLFQDTECRQLKNDLLGHGDWATGRVKLASFYQAALEHGSWQFNEHPDYLRQIGALDESDPLNPRVIVANYVNSPGNCVASSSFYSVCCLNECEALLAHLEREITSPEGEPAYIVDLVESLPTSTVEAPRKLSATLVARLQEVALGHGGTVPLHGRLFAQWMHHAFPRECPFPHVSGTTNPQTADEWVENNGRSSAASKAEMRHVVETAALRNIEQDKSEELHWNPEEELLVVRAKPATQTSSRGVFAQVVRTVFLFVALVSAAIGLVRSARLALPGEEGEVWSKKVGRGGRPPAKTLEKYLV